MAEKSIIWSERAIIELKETLEFYAERNGNADYSIKILNKTENLLEALTKNEFIGRLTENKQTRVVVMDAYLIFMKFTNNKSKYYLFGIIGKIQRRELIQKSKPILEK